MSPLVRAELQYPRLWFCLGLFIALVVAVLSLIPAQDLPAIGISDKVRHTLAYVLLAFWFCSVVVRRSVLAMVAALFAFGVLIELVQYWMGWGRSAELADVAANAAGIVVGITLAMTPLGRWILLLDSRLSRIRA